MTLAVFDLHWLEDHDVTPLPDRARRRLLEELAPGCCCRPPDRSEDASVLIGCCDELGVEGLVLKNTHAPYEPGKHSPARRKVKTATWRGHTGEAAG